MLVNSKQIIFLMLVVISQDALSQYFDQIYATDTVKCSPKFKDAELSFKTDEYSLDTSEIDLVKSVVDKGNGKVDVVFYRVKEEPLFVEPELYPEIHDQTDMADVYHDNTGIDYPDDTNLKGNAATVNYSRELQPRIIQINSHSNYSTKKRKKQRVYYSRPQNHNANSRSGAYNTRSSKNRKKHVQSQTNSNKRTYTSTRRKTNFRKNTNTRTSTNKRTNSRN